MATNPDFRDLFVALSDAGAEYLIVGAPNRIDVITSIDAVGFDEAWSAKVATTYGGVPIHLLSRDHLLRNERAVNRLQDQLDVERLTRET